MDDITPEALDSLVAGLKKAGINTPLNGSVPSGIRPLGFQNASGSFHHASAKPHIGPGELLLDDGKGKLSRLIDSLAAEVVASALDDILAWDRESQSWLLWQGTHWQPQPSATTAEGLIASAVTTGTKPMGFRVAYLNGITQIIQRRDILQRPPRPAGVVPFLNGLLDLKSGTLRPASPTDSLDWVLPHRYAKGADCPTIRSWLTSAVDDDGDTVELLRAWLAALVRGLPVQRFLMLKGRGGTGKSTFERLAGALIGDSNLVITSLRDLEENRFESAKLFGKRLCQIHEAGRHGGALNVLKSITGGDALRLERKHVQQTGSFVFGGLVLLATNEDMQTSDSTSGLERRRIQVRFNRTVTSAEKADWEAKGGEAAVLHTEIPGLVNWLLALPESAIRDRLENLPDRVRKDNLLGMAAGNSCADWLLECVAPDPEASQQIGVKQECRDKDSGATYYANASEWLYPNYLTYCQEHGRARPVSARKFSDTVLDIAEHLGHVITRERHPSTRAYQLVGLRLRTYADDDQTPEDLWRVSETMAKGNGSQPPPYRKDRKSGRQIFTPENSSVPAEEVF